MVYLLYYHPPEYACMDEPTLAVWHMLNIGTGFMYQWRMQDFPQGGAPTPKIAIIFQIFAKNCMKMKEFGPPGGGGARPWRPP